MSQMVLKSFRLSPLTALEIQQGAKEEQVSQNTFLKRILWNYQISKMKKQMERDIRRASKDPEYQRQQVEMANEIWT